LKQSRPPRYFLLIDDGSEDLTPEIAKRFQFFYPNFIYKRLSYNRSPIKGVNLAYCLNWGVRFLTELCPDWDYLLKVDADIIIPPSYAETLMIVMRFMGWGITGGMPIGEKIRLSRVTDGARVYSRRCWDEIGGLDLTHAFDTHALLKARQLGWEVRTFRYQRYLELRRAIKRRLRDWIYSGFIRKSFHFPLWHTCLAGLKNIKSGPRGVIGPLAMILAHALGRWPEDPKLKPDFIRNLAKEEMREYLTKIWQYLAPSTGCREVLD